MTLPRDASYPCREHLKTTFAVPQPPASQSLHQTFPIADSSSPNPSRIFSYLHSSTNPPQPPDCPSTPTPRPPWPNTTPNPPPPTTLPPNPSTSTNPPTRRPSRATAPLPKPPPPNTLTATRGRKTPTANPKTMPTVVVRVPDPDSWGSAAAAEQRRV